MRLALCRIQVVSCRMPETSTNNMLFEFVCFAAEEKWAEARGSLANGGKWRERERDRHRERERDREGERERHREKGGGEIASL